MSLILHVYFVCFYFLKALECVYRVTCHFAQGGFRQITLPSVSFPGSAPSTLPSLPCVWLLFQLQADKWDCWAICGCLLPNTFSEVQTSAAVVWNLHVESRQLLEQRNSWVCLLGCVIADGMRGDVEGPEDVMSQVAVRAGPTSWVLVFFTPVWFSPPRQRNMSEPRPSLTHSSFIHPGEDVMSTVYRLGNEHMCWKAGSCIRLDSSGKGLPSPSLLRQSKTHP